MSSWPPEGIDWFYHDATSAIACGDNRELFPRLKLDAKTAAMVTDPPYGIKADDQKRILSRINKAMPKDYGWSNWDSAPPEKWVLDMMRSRTRWQVIWGGNYFDLPPQKGWLVWDKDNSGDFADCELAWTNFDMAVRMFQFRWNGMLQENMKDKEVRFHPTQKPVPLMGWCLEFLPEPPSVIVDPYMGAGTTLVAAQLRGWKAIGIDSEMKHCESAKARLAQQVLITP